MDYVEQFLKDLFNEPVRITQEYDNYWAGHYPFWGGRHKGIDIAPVNRGNRPLCKFITYGTYKDGFDNAYGNWYEVFDGEYYWKYGHFNIRLFHQEQAIAQEVCGEMGSTGDSTGNHTHIECYKKILGIKIYYNPIIIYTKYMEKLIELEKSLKALDDKINGAVNQICVMEDKSVRIKSDKNKTFHVMKKDDAGKEAITTLWKLKGRDKYKESEFDGYKEI